MGYLGDDLVTPNVFTGMTDVQNLQAAEALAKLHASFWNADGTQDIPHMFKPADSRSFILGLLGPVDEVVETHVGEKYREKYGDKFAE
jgi:hypothetical protein